MLQPAPHALHVRQHQASERRGVLSQLCCAPAGGADALCAACRHWVQLEWDQAAIQTLLREKFPWLVASYARLRHPAMQADVAIAMVLHT